MRGLTIVRLELGLVESQWLVEILIYEMRYNVLCQYHPLLMIKNHCKLSLIQLGLMCRILFLANRTVCVKLLSRCVFS